MKMLLIQLFHFLQEFLV